jgi:hypothetical protein
VPSCWGQDGGLTGPRHGASLLHGVCHGVRDSFALRVEVMIKTGGLIAVVRHTIMANLILTTQPLVLSGNNSSNNGHRVTVRLVLSNRIVPLHFRIQRREI